MLEQASTAPGRQMTAWGPGDFSKPKWIDWNRLGYKAFRMGFWPFVVALIAGAGWIIYKTWVWVLQ